MTDIGMNGLHARPASIRSRCELALIGLLLGSLLIETAAIAAVAPEKWGPFRGRVIDVETGEGIAGAAILVVWYEMVPHPVQTNQKFYDAVEAVTDADGRFDIPRRPVPPSDANIRLAGVTYFAPGYVIHSEAVTPPTGQSFVDPTDVRMRKLRTRQELWEKNRGRPSMVPDSKMPAFLKAIEAEYGMLYPGERRP